MTSAQKAISIILKFVGKDQDVIEDAVNKVGELEEAQKKVSKATPKASLWKKYNAALEKSKAKMEKFITVGQKTALVGAGMTALVSVPIVAFFNGATNAASDLNETVSKTEAVFKQSSTEILNWAKTADKSMGLSERAALDFASSFGTALKQIGGLDEAAAGKQAQVLTQLTSDLNSFYNTDTADEALFSSLTGEFEPLKKFGVVINETIVAQKALEMGLGDGKKALSAQAKQAATLAIIMEKTKDAQGDFARTSEGFANKQRIVAAQFENVKATLGQQLLPLKLKLLEIVSSLIERFTSLSPETQKMVLIFSGIAAVIGPLLVGIGGLVAAFGAIMPVITAVTSVGLAPLAGILAAVAAGVALLWAGWQILTPVIQQAVTNIQAIIASWVSQNQPLIDSIKAKWNSLVTQARQLWTGIQQAFSQIASVVSSELNKTLAPFGGTEKVMKNLMTVAGIMASQFLSAMGKILGAASSNLPGVVSAISSVISKIGEVIRAFISFSASAVSNFNKAISAAKNVASAIPAVFSGLAAKLQQIGSDIVNGLVNGIKSGAGKVKAAAESLAAKIPGPVKSVLGIRSPSRVMAEMGRFVVAGLVLGLSNVAPAEQAAEALAVKTLAKFEQQLADGAKNNKDIIDKFLGDASGQFSLHGGFGGGIDSGSFSSGFSGGGYGGEDSYGGIHEAITAEQRLEEERLFFDERLLLLQEKGLQETAVYQQIEEHKRAAVLATRDLQRNAVQSGFSDILSITAAFAGKQSGLYRAMFIAQKAFAVKDTIIKGYQAVQNTLATVPFPANIGAAIGVGVKTAANVAGIVSQGFRSGGFTGNGGVTEAAGIVHGREFVSNAATTARERGTLEYLHAGGTTENIVNNSYAAGAGASSPTVIMVDSRAAADQIAAGIDGPVTIQDVTDAISDHRP